LEEHVPAFVHRLFEDGLQEGFGLNDLAVLAAAFQNLVRDDAIWRLATIANAEGFVPGQAVTEEEGSALVENYMAMYLLGGTNGTAITHNALEKRRQKLEALTLLHWPEVKRFAGDIYKEVVQKALGSADSSAGTPMIAFRQVEQAVEAVGERFGKFQNQDCSTLKQQLLEIEEQGTGRVSLEVFHKSGRAFSETSDQLRAMGALDETVRGRPQVVIPNYLTSTANCISTASLYDICCMDECEALMGDLEARVGGPDAAPAIIAGFVSDIPSSTVEAPREMPERMTLRLEEIARRHGGRVKIHGRLFAQWMHHAYPRECPSPGTGSKTSSAPKTADEWLTADKGYDETSALGEAALTGTEGELLSWSEEEVLVSQDMTVERPSECWVLLKGLLTIGGLFALMLTISNVSAKREGKKNKW
jgi:hypothetical protein